MEEKIAKALEYYTFKSNEILEVVNSSKTLKVNEIISYGEELSILEYKITALEVANEN